jgi:FkbM family methyltransferase
MPAQLKDLLRTASRKPMPFGLADRTRRQLERSPRRKAQTITFRGKPLTVCDAASFLSAHQDIFVRRSYLFPTSQKTGLIIDAGANVGLASLWFSANYPGFRVIAIEADPTIFGLLEQNLQLQQANNVSAKNCAVWDTDHAMLSFSSDGADSGHVLEGVPGSVQSLRLRRLIEAEPVEMLKLDIEGAEVRVLNDCRGALESVKNLFVEYHSSVAEPQQLSVLLNVLEESGFRYYLENPGPNSVHPLMSWPFDSGHDLRINIWASRTAALENS